MARISEAEKRYYAATTFFLQNLEATNASVNTVNNYARRLELFRRSWLGGHTTHAAISDPGVCDVLRWREELVASGCRPTTIRQYLTELSTFFGATSDEAMGESCFYHTNPVAKRLIPNTRNVEKRPYELLLSDADVMKLWRYNPVATTHPENWPRNYAIVIFLLTTKIRNSELLSITPDCLDFQNAEIVVERGKGGKFRRADFPEIAQLAVRIYLSSGLRPNFARSDEPLFGTFGSSHGAQTATRRVWQRGSTQWLSSLVERHVRSVTGVPDIRTHDLRHIGARLDLNNGKSMEQLQSELGHSSMTTTQIYSDKLMARADRISAVKVYQERDRQAARLCALLSRETIK